MTSTPTPRRSITPSPSCPPLPANSDLRQSPSPMIQSMEDFGSPSPGLSTGMMVDPHNWVRQPPWAPTTQRVRPPFLGPDDGVPVPE